MHCGAGQMQRPRHGACSYARAATFSRRPANVSRHTEAGCMRADDVAHPFLCEGGGGAMCAIPHVSPPVSPRVCGEQGWWSHTRPVVAHTAGGRTQGWWSYTRLVAAHRAGGRTQGWWSHTRLVAAHRAGGRTHRWWSHTRLVVTHT
eukprot:363660-Chlamydomonas_euryale.AAC.4